MPWCVAVQRPMFTSPQLYSWSSILIVIFGPSRPGIALPGHVGTQRMQRLQIVPGLMSGSGSSSASVRIVPMRTRGPNTGWRKTFDQPISPRPQAIAAMRTLMLTSGAGRPGTGSGCSGYDSATPGYTGTAS